MSVLHRAVLGLSVVALLAAAVLPAAAAELPYRSDQKFANGLWMVTFETPAGQIRVNLPERLIQGERVSGTVELYPGGEGRQLQDNLAALAAHTLRIDGEEIAAADRPFRWNLAAGEANGRIELLDAAGAAVANVPANLAPAGSGRQERSFTLPQLVQRGRAFLIRGPFDGDFASTRVTLAGRPAAKIAESSELLVVANDAGRLGRVRAVVAEGARRKRAALNSIEIRLSAPEGAASPGEEMAVKVRIEGLKGLRQPFSLALYNHHPEVAALEGNTAGPLVRLVHPEDIAGEDAYELNLKAAVKAAGTVSMKGALNATDVAEHVVNVSWPPHTENVTFPTYHAENVTWPPHTANVSFPSFHAPNETWPPHVPNGTFPTYHALNVTWPPHTANVTFPNYHALNITWPPHVPNGTFAGVHGTNVTWPPHTPNVSFPPYHITNLSWPVHQPNVTWPPPPVAKDDQPGEPVPADSTSEKLP